MEIKEETMEILDEERRVNESYDEVIKRLVSGEDAQTGRTFRIFVPEDAYEKAREESYRVRIPIGVLLSKIISKELNVMNKKTIKSGDIVGIVPEEIQKQLIKFDIVKREAWRKLESITTEEVKLWEQIKRDLELSDKFQYNINNVTGEVIVVRNTETYEQAMQKRVAEIIVKGKKEEEQ